MKVASFQLVITSTTEPFMEISLAYAPGNSQVGRARLYASERVATCERPGNAAPSRFYGETVGVSLVRGLRSGRGAATDAHVVSR
jgi:hypothetical protein